MSDHCPNIQSPLEAHDMVSQPYAKELKDRLYEILNENFMQKYTNFENFDHFQFSSAVFLNWNSSVIIYSEARLDGFVEESTTFKTWKEMLTKAVEVFEF